MKKSYQHTFPATMKKPVWVLIFVLALYGSATAQQDLKGYFGLGAGLDYGGFGLKVEMQPVPSIGIFGGVGYNLAELGYNIGGSFKLRTEKKLQPFATAMYGYNGVLVIQGYGGKRTTVSHGLSAGAGFDLYDRNLRNKFTFEVLVPFREQAFTNYYNQLKEAGYTFQSSLLPVAFSVGYQFALSKVK